MSANEIHQEDIGTAFTITMMDDTVVVDISTATIKQITFKKPSGTKIVKDAVFVTDGTDGKLQYTSISGDLDEAGKWYLQVYLDMTGFTGHSDFDDFVVYANL